ncbi:hypothetical protein AC790_18460 [Pantoea sp. RIT-PI-b]|nr:hypothetical protein AC790_18460 [Pantoea sp. RIT-PI-b]
MIFLEKLLRSVIYSSMVMSASGTKRTAIGLMCAMSEQQTLLMATHYDEINIQSTHLMCADR